MTNYLEIKKCLEDWPHIVVKYQKSSLKKGVAQIITSHIPYLLIWVFMYFSLSWTYILTLFLALLNAFFLVRIFIIQHDCGHKSFFKSRKLNDVVGFACSFFSTIPYKYWARTHSFHHAHTGQLEHRDIGDIDFLTLEEFRKKSKFERFRYKLFRTPINLFFILPIMYLLIAIRFPFINMNGWKLTRKSQVVNNIAILIGYSVLAYFIGLQSLLLIQGPIVVMFGVIAFWFFYVQHQHERTYMQWSENWEYLLSAIKGSTYYKLPKIFQWFTGNIGFHHIHHLSTLIPNYNLETCAKENPILQQYVRILTFRESLKCMFLKLWDEEQQRMITFREYKMIEQARLQPIKMEVMQNHHHNQLN